MALLVLEHQVTVHNEIIHANYKSRVLLERLQPQSDPASQHWAQLTPQLQSRFDLMLRPLVDALLLADSAPLPRPVAGSNGYAQRFQARGPADPQGRSRRQLDLNTQVFRYPLSFLIYSEGFDALPLFVREHVYAQLARILQSPDPGKPYSSRSAAERKAALRHPGDHQAGVCPRGSDLHAGLTTVQCSVLLVRTHRGWRRSRRLRAVLQLIGLGR